MLERRKNNVQVTNVYLQEIKRKYPLVFEMAVRAGEVLAETCEVNINENELAIFSFAFRSSVRSGQFFKTLSCDYDHS